MRRWSLFGGSRRRKFGGEETCRTLVVLGSGGHTMEMLALLRELPHQRYTPMAVVIAQTDERSLPNLEVSRPDLFDQIEVFRIRRSREVGQSYISSIWTTLLATLDSVKVIFKFRPHLILCNGPGTCIPICMGGILVRFIAVEDPRIVFVESFARVQTLSLTGHLLYYMADRFVVQWPQLSKKYPRAEYIGNLF